jgi:hypothetical protein
MFASLQLRRRVFAFATFLGLALSLFDATAQVRNVAPGFAGLQRQDSIALLPVDLELFSLSAGGVAEPKADWTAAAQGHMKSAVEAKRLGLGLSTVELSESEADEFAEQIGLHAAVANAVSLHHVTGGAWALPTKAGQLDWNFGNAMQPLRAKTGARYGLFIWVRDSYASTERKVAMVGLALFGIVATGGAQVGYASLVDLETGQLVWFNRLLRVQGDLREAVAARETVDALLAGFPAVR